MRNPFHSRLSFQTKVLIPVLAFLVLAPVVTSWIVQSRVSAQFERDVNRKLETAEKIFENSRDIRNQFLRSRYRNFAQEPSFKAVAKLFVDKGEPSRATVKEFFREYLTGTSQNDRNPAKIIVFTTTEDETVSHANDSHFRELEEHFTAASRELARRAFESDIENDVVVVDEKLFTAISVPVRVNEMLIGALTIAVPIDAATAAEFASQTDSEIALIAGSSIAATTLPARRINRSLQPLLGSMKYGEPQQVVIADEHYRALPGSVAALPEGQRFGYVLLSSYEQSHRDLQQTQATIWLVAGGGIILSACIVWLLIGRVTEPLRRLRDTAEAVGRGDFSKRLAIETNDELGALGATFNKMTQNLDTSRAELEKTVDTLRTTQNQLIQREKLSAVGEFVAGVAHELNNPLTSLIGFAELLKASGIDPKHATHVNFIFKSAHRCHKIVQSLLSFARQHPPERKIVNVGELLDSVLEFLTYELRTSNIEVQTRYDSTLPRIIGDSHQLQQVVLNILNNARQAIQSHKPDGQIRIKAERAAHLVRITISDNGPGISAENLSKIFDPFFTTKAVGQGTGLGLSLCYGIIKEHGGSIHVTSEPGLGARFIIELPAASASAIASMGGADGTSENSKGGAGKSILVIDDEEWILTLTKKVLEEDGYSVDTVSDGQMALNAVAKKEYDLVVCDQKMPGLSGPQVYERLREQNSKTAERFIFMTGDVVGEGFQKFLKDSGRFCLTKPFSLRELRSTVSESLQNH